MSKLAEYQRVASDVFGYFDAEAQGAWDALLCHQDRREIAGHFLEIGVHEGKSALLSALHARPDEWQVYCDIHFPPAARARIGEGSGRRACFVEKDSRDLSAADDLPAAGPTYRWIHLDGGHEGPVLAGDLRLADGLLAEDGLIIVDDFFSPRYPQITDAVLAQIRADPDRLALVLVGFNKAYLARPPAVPAYLRYLRDEFYDDLRARGIDDVLVHKSDLPGGLNAFGYTSGFGGRVGYLGLDDRPDVIAI